MKWTNDSSILTRWEKIKYPFIQGFLISIYFFQYEVKYFFQRLFRGYDDQAIWNLNIYIARKMTKPLKKLRTRHYGYPCELNDDKWNEILDKIIYSVEEVARDDGYLLSEDYKKIQEGFELLGKYFTSLWD